MKKIILIGALIMLLGVATIYFMGGSGYDVSDHDVAMMHANKLYEDIYDDLHVVICEGTDAEVIHYQCYDDDTLLNDTYLYREAARDILMGEYDEMQD